jgi:LDH2 family malate/lactate/ureidoglycolate dehydrogenase
VGDTTGRTLGAEALQEWTSALLAGAGLEDDAAATVADTLVATSLRGVDSHGVARVPIYVERLRAGVLNPRPRPRVIRSDGAVALVDGDRGPGQIAGLFATDLSIELAREFGVGVVSVCASNPYGAAGIYASRAAAAGMIGVSTTNADPLAVPFGGARKALGTNPIAFAAPTETGLFVFDMATSQVAANKVFNARDEGRPIPEGWAVDEAGVAITDPNEFYAVVPLGGYKGYGLALMVEVLSGVLAGAGVTHGVGGLYANVETPQDLGHFHLALDPERTIGRERFAALLSGLLGELRANPPAPGFDEVLVAGDPEERAERERRRGGIPLPPALTATLEALSAELGVAVPG